jgi:neutral ceramidase
MENQEQLFASAVQVDITPPVGHGFDGYAARAGKSQGVHDPLLGQVLLLRSGKKQIVLITLDLLGVSLDFTRKVRAGIEQAVGVPLDGTIIVCSHTHSSAAGFLPPHPGITTSVDLGQQEVVSRQLIGAAVWANHELQPATLGLGRGEVEGIGLNRNDPAQPVDPEVTVLRIDALFGQPLAVLINYGCHPTVLGYQNLLYSADYPGAVRSTLRKIYPETIFMYTNGASGDISSRFTRRDQSFHEVERMGRILGGEVLKVMQTITTQPEQELESRVIPVELGFRPFPGHVEAQRELKRLTKELENLKANNASHGEIRKAVTRVEGATGQAAMAEELEGRSGNKSQVHFLKIGDLALVGLPGEPFTRTVLEIKEGSPHPHTIVLSYANDYQGYFPDRVSIAMESYEALISPYGADVADRLRQTALDLLKGSSNA